MRRSMTTIAPTQVITVTNQKGGTGKTTTALFTAYGLANRGYSVLLIDLDSQADATYTTKAKYDKDKTSLEVLLKDVKPADAIVPTTARRLSGKVDLIPASPQLATLDLLITKRQLLDPQYNLDDALQDIRYNYDYIVLDTPPALSTAVLNALTASDYVVVPAQADIFSLKGLGQLAQTITAVKRRSNTRLKVAGILLGRYDKRTNFTKAVTDMLKDTSAQLDTQVFDTKTREAIAVKEAQGKRTDLFSYAPSANVTADVNSYINELIGVMI